LTGYPRAHRAFTLAGREEHAFPTPLALLTVDSLPGLPARRISWLHEIARAAVDDRLDATKLAADDPEVSMAALRTLPGIGPFYAALVQVRATGATDVLPVDEPRVLAAAGTLYGQPGPSTQREFEAREPNPGLIERADIGFRARRVDPGLRCRSR
jgi:DNA-3-methyladenine glycosylase II